MVLVVFQAILLMIVGRRSKMGFLRMHALDFTEGGREHVLPYRKVACSARHLRGGEGWHLHLSRIKVQHGSFCLPTVGTLVSVGADKVDLAQLGLCSGLLILQPRDLIPC